MAETGQSNAAIPTNPTETAGLTVPAELPLLTLGDLVVFPDLAVPLLVSTPQSIKLIDEVVAGDRLVAVTLQKNPDDDHPKLDQLFHVGVVARVLRMLKFPDESVRVLIQGLKRIRVEAITREEPYLVARVTPLEN